MQHAIYVVLLTQKSATHDSNSFKRQRRSENHADNPSKEGYALISHVFGTLSKYTDSSISSISGVIVSSPCENILHLTFAVD